MYMPLKACAPRTRKRKETRCAKGLEKAAKYGGSELKNSDNKGIIFKIAAVILKLRFPIIIIFLAAGVFCALSIGKTRTNSDLTIFLPDTMETRCGLTVMNEEFVAYGSARIMVSNISYEKAEELADRLAEYPRVLAVDFDDSTAHYVNSAALFSISFDGPSGDEEIVASYRAMKDELSFYDIYTDSEIGEDLVGEIAKEMIGVVALSALVIAVILLFTSRSYFEVIIYAIVFVFAAILNMGTNFLLGEISTISNTICVILQLALAIDYAIIFAHRYQDEAELQENYMTALRDALAKSIIEISSSSLTTISGLVALMFMQFTLGRDLGLVLSKGIVCSMLTVFLLMPALISVFPGAIKRTGHRTLVPNMEPWGRFLTKSGYIFVWFFIIAFPVSYYFSHQLDWSFSTTQTTELIYSESRYAMHKINDTFSDDTVIALLVPAEDFGKEKQTLADVAELPGIKSATGLANIQIDDEHTLTDKFTPRMFADLLDVDIEEARLLFMGYGVKNQQYQAILGNVDSCEVPLVDLFLYLLEKVDQGVVTLDGDNAATLESLRGTLNMALDQLRGKNWNRMVFKASVPEQGQQSVELVEQIRDAAEKYYGPGSVIVIGDITSTRDLQQSYTGDNTLITILTIVIIFVILVFTFRTIVGSMLMVLVIEGSICINFTISYFLGHKPFFMTNMIVSAIQMGATIDYAIVLMNRYLIRCETLPKKEAMAKAVNESFATVITSGAIMTIAGCLIGYMVSDVYVGHIGLGVGRGAFCSVILVMTVLPQMLLLFDGLIKKTTVHVKIKVPEEGEL